jgi:hypothetical protein
MFSWTYNPLRSLNMIQVSITFERHKYYVDSEMALYASAFRLPDRRVLTIVNWRFGMAHKDVQVEVTTSEELWKKLPTLELLAEDQAPPRYQVNFKRRRYESQPFPWMFSRTSDTGTVLYAIWRDSASETNVRIPSELSELYYHEQLFELLPIAVPA